MYSAHRFCELTYLGDGDSSTTQSFATTVVVVGLFVITIVMVDTSLNIIVDLRTRLTSRLVLRFLSRAGSRGSATGIFLIQKGVMSLSQLLQPAASIQPPHPLEVEANKEFPSQDTLQTPRPSLVEPVTIERQLACCAHNIKARR